MKVILTSIIVAGAVQGLFLSVLVYKKTELKTSRTFLVLILAFFSINIIINELLQNIAGIRPDFMLSSAIFQFFLGPMVLFYVRSLTEENYRHKFSDLIHLIPLMCYNVFMIVIHIHKELIGLMSVFNKIIWGIIIIQLTAYLFVAKKKINAFDERLKDNFSSTEKINLGWMNFVFISLLILLSFYFVLYIVLLHNGDRVLINKLMSIILSCFVYVFGYKGLQQKPVTIPYQDTETSVDKIKYSKSLLSPEFAEHWKNRLISFIETEKPFLDPDLSLPLLSGLLDIQENKLSQIINNNLKTTFYDLINKCRIEEVINLLSSEPEKSILEIAFQAGFNSKTAFNVIFKKATGLTPSQYRISLKK